MSDEVGAMVFLFGAIILPIIGLIAFVIWAIFHEMNHSKKMKEDTSSDFDGENDEGQKKQVSMKQILVGWVISTFLIVSFLLNIDDIASFLNN